MPVRADLAPVAPAAARRPARSTTPSRSPTRWWTAWSGRAPQAGRWADAVRDSLVVLKGLTYAPTGGIVAAATTSLPEAIGGPRNWDYRYCWLRDATFTLLALMGGGYTDEAAAWRDWLLRALAGRPDAGPDHVRPRWRAPADRARARLAPGLRGLAPGPDRQRRPPSSSSWTCSARCSTRSTRPGWSDIADTDGAWDLETALVDGGRGPLDAARRRHLGGARRPAALHPLEGHGVGGARPRHPLGRPGSASTRRSTAGGRVCDEIRAEVLERGVDDRGVFVQSYGSKALDASCLMIPLVGFLPADDERVVATVEAIDRELTEDGFVRRYHPDQRPTTASRAARARSSCARSGWPTASRSWAGRTRRRSASSGSSPCATTSACSPSSTTRRRRRMLGNVPQAFSHVSLVSTAADR